MRLRPRCQFSLAGFAKFVLSLVIGSLISIPVFLWTYPQLKKLPLDAVLAVFFGTWFWICSLVVFGVLWNQSRKR